MEFSSLCNRLIIVFLFALCYSCLSAQALIDHPNPIVDSIRISQDIFEVETPARITLKLDIKAFAKKKYDDEYQKAELSYEFKEQGVTITNEVRIKARGNSRKKRCFFPPIKLNISKADVKNKYLEDTKTIKLVTHCKQSLTYETYILKEYLVYKLYNVITPNSFRVRLLEVDYVDTGKKGKNVDTWAFLIEPEGMLAERLDMFNIKNNELSQKYMEPEDMVRVSLFNYMIGNTDFSVNGRHNLKVLQPNDVTQPLGIPVPYDFDYSGLVNATYAVPYEGLGIKSVKERYYVGLCQNEASFESILKEFLNKKEQLLKVVEDFQYLEPRDKKYVINYLNEFFEEAKRPSFISNHIKSTCL